MASPTPQPRPVFLYAHGLEPAPVRASNLEDALAKFLYDMEKQVRDWHEMSASEVAADLEKRLKRLGFTVDDSRLQPELLWKKPAPPPPKKNCWTCEHSGLPDTMICQASMAGAQGVEDWRHRLFGRMMSPAEVTTALLEADGCPGYEAKP